MEDMYGTDVYVDKVKRNRRQNSTVDYGKWLYGPRCAGSQGFRKSTSYLTEQIELAKEWAVCRPNVTNGWVHQYELDTSGLKILDFQGKDVVSWLAELMKHRDADDSRRYRVLSEKFIDKYGIDTKEYDVIKGWRANASYFYIAKEFVRDNIDIDILPELLSLGGLGIQYCIKSPLAYSKLREIKENLVAVEYEEFRKKYNQRDISVREKMRELVNSDANKVTNVFSTLF